MTFQELGQFIKLQREAVGMSIDDVASRIKISARILRSIEEGSNVGLPHAVYTKSFARSFGLLVGCDAAELSAALEAVFPAESLDESKMECVLVNNASDSYPGTFRRFIALLAVLIVLAGLGGGIWYVASRYGDQIVDMVKQPFSAKSGAEDPQAPTSPSGNATESSTGPSSVDTVFLSLMRETTEPAPPLVVAKPEPIPAAQTAFGSPASAGVAAFEPELEQEAVNEKLAPEAYLAQAGGADLAEAQAQPPVLAVEPVSSRAEGKNNLLISCIEACWISSRADGARGRDYTLQPGESFALTYQKQLELTLGNAGGVSLEHNGISMGAPGRRGQRIVLRFPNDNR